MAKGKLCRKVVLNQSQLEECSRFASVGLTLDQIAALLEVSPATLDEIIKRQPEVAQAIEKGRCNGIGKVAATLYQQAVKGNMTAAIFFLKTRARWAEAKSHEDLPEKGMETISVTPENIAELCRLAREGSKPKDESDK